MRSMKPIRLEAIYVPYKNRCSNLVDLLQLLSFFDGPIYLMISKDSTHPLLPDSLSTNARMLYVEENFHAFFANLRTSNHRCTIADSSKWDLPLKRSFAITHAVAHGYEKMLFIDDDIRPESASELAIGATCLEQWTIAGCFVDEFIDTSVFGHLKRVAGEEVHPFLSGSFLFVKPANTVGFFPCIYNEDWLFMLPQVLNASICSFGSVAQIPFDPFNDVKRPGFQEFGDIVAEGLYSLAASNAYDCRFDLQFWRRAILERQELFGELARSLTSIAHQRIIAAALAANRSISPEDCHRFVFDWEQDQVTWRDYMSNL